MAAKDILPFLMSLAETTKKRMKNPSIMWDEMNRPMDNPNPNDPMLVPGKSPEDLAMEYAFGWGMPASYLGGKFSRDILDNLPRESRVPSNMSRRDFMKQGAGLTAGAVAAKYGLGKIGTPIGERTGKEVAESIAPKAAAKAAPKYKYNSLKEYLDNVNNAAMEEAKYLSKETGKPREAFLDIERRRILKQDEAAYNTAKGKTNPTYNEWQNEQWYKDKLNEFSPDAKATMEELKYSTNPKHDWTDFALMEMEYSKAMDIVNSLR